MFFFFVYLKKNINKIPVSFGDLVFFSAWFYKYVDVARCFVSQQRERTWGTSVMVSWSVLHSHRTSSCWALMFCSKAQWLFLLAFLGGWGLFPEALIVDFLDRNV